MEEKKLIQVINADNLRLLVQKANENEISKDDIITIVESSGMYFLIYYK